MTNYAKIAMAAICLILGGCGMTNPYEKWLDEGQNDQEKLLPSKLKAVLCDVETWKVDYEGTDVFFQFGSDWSLVSDSDIPQVATSSTYNMMSLSAKEISLTLVGAGHLAYVDKGADASYVVKAFSNTSISATGKTSGKEITLVPADDDVMEKLAATKEALLATVKVCKSFVSSGYKTAAVHNADGDFVCRFAINPEARTLQFDVIADGTLTHTVVPVEAPDDDNLNFETAIKLDGKDINGLAFSGIGVILKGGDGLAVKPNGDSRVYFLSGDYQTHALNVNGGRGEAVQYLIDEITPHDEWGDIEVSDRETRPLVFCPENDKDHYWYTFFDSFKEEDGATVSEQYNDIIFMSKSDGYMPFGGWDDGNGGEFDNAKEIQNDLPRFMNGYFHKDGLILVHDFDGEGYSYYWFFSPTTDFWFRARE